MSASDPNSYVALTDTPKEIAKKINKHAFSGGQPTIDEHRSKGGDPDVDVAYQWLLFFEEDDAKVTEYYKDYKAGRILSGEMKRLIIDRLVSILGNHQEKREQARKQLDQYISLS